MKITEIKTDIKNRLDRLKSDFKELDDAMGLIDQ